MTNQTKQTNETHDLTELVFILDRSGSMGGLEEDTIGGFNAMLTRQRKEAGAAFVSTLLFDHETVVLHDRLPLEKVPLMTRDDYQVRGSTALVDALGGAIRHITNIHKYARREDVPRRTLFVVTTDGLENASCRFTSDQVKAMVQERQEQAGWEFLFLGANIDAVETAAHLGIRPDQAVNFRSDSQGTRTNYDALSQAVSQVRQGAPLGTGWRASIDADFQKRGGKKPRRFWKMP
jgi:hypothetical protein